MDRHRSHDDAGCARLDRAPGGIDRTDATTDLERDSRLSQPFPQPAIRSTAARTLEIHDVHQLSAPVDPLQAHLGRVVPVRRDPIVFPLAQTYDASTENIDRGQHLHGCFYLISSS
jgi:hypothetical protein